MRAPTSKTRASIAEALAIATKHLKDAGHDSARLEAEVLLAHVLDITRTRLYVDMPRPLEEDKAETFAALVQRHLADEPVAYIVGRREFFGLPFYVDRRVLIPRPETELLVEKAVEVAREHGGATLTVADVGTGSGAIAISLALALPGAKVYAIDASPSSLEVAAVNCRAHGVADRVTLLAGDLLSPLPGRADVVVANLPYIPSADVPTLPPDVAGFEPATALDGGPDGLDIYRRLLRQVPEKLTPGGHVFLETAADQGPAMVALVAQLLPGVRAHVDQDYAGLDRVVSLQFPEVRR